MDTLLCNDDGDIVLGTYQPSNTLLSLSADQYTAGSATWSDQSGNGLDFTVSTNASLKGIDADGFPYMNFGGSYGHAKRLVGSTLTNIPAPTTGKYTIFCVTQILNSTASYRTLTRGTTEDHQILIETGNNNLGLYDNNGSNFVDSGFDVTTDMTSTRNLLVWELSTTVPIYKFQLNESGTDSTITSATNYTLPFASLGGVSDSQYWGNIYEFIVYDGVLSASERAYVAEYLTHKWDISSKLPSSFTSTHGVLTNEETLAFLYAGSGTETETTYTWDAEGVTYADILVVGGGGGGRTRSSPSFYDPGGGGGGGEVVYRQGVPVTPGVEIKVGRGGPNATQGGISQFTSSIQANGGGRGASGSGGSGGGASRNGTTPGASVKLSVDGMGNVGGVSVASGAYGAAGGGGASQAGFNVTSGSGSNGGEGYASNVFGVWNTVYGSGGGGGARSGGNGVGGTNAGNGGNPGGTGVAHTGSGGGGGQATTVNNVNEPGIGGPGGSGIVLVKPNPGALDGLGSSVYTQAVGAYALRRLFGAYTGAQVRLRRSTDNAETDVTFDKYGYPVNFDVETWLEGGTGYVVTWYDQGPNATHTTGYGTTLPSIYKREDGLYVIYFPGTSTTAGGYFNAGSVTLNIATNGGVSTFSRVNFLGANSWERVYDYGSGQSNNNLLFARSGTSTRSVLQLHQGSAFKYIEITDGIVNNTWQSFGNRIQGSGSSWVFTTRKDGTETAGTAQSITYTDRTITNSYIGRSNWADQYANMYLTCQIFFNTGSITSEQFGVMENVLY
jgi:hypothetical protein